MTKKLIKKQQSAYRSILPYGCTEFAVKGRRCCTCREWWRRGGGGGEVDDVARNGGGE